MRETGEEREREREKLEVGREEKRGKIGGRGLKFSTCTSTPAHSSRAASYGIIIANHDRYLPARIEFDRRKSARGATWFHPASVHLLLFFPPPWLFNFPPCPAWKEEKEDGEEGGEKKRRGAGQGKQEQKTSGLGFFPTEAVAYSWTARSGSSNA